MVPVRAEAGVREAYPSSAYCSTKSIPLVRWEENWSSATLCHTPIGQIALTGQIESHLHA